MRTCLKVNRSDLLKRPFSLDKEDVAKDQCNHPFSPGERSRVRGHQTSTNHTDSLKFCPLTSILGSRFLLRSTSSIPGVVSLRERRPAAQNLLCLPDWRVTRKIKITSPLPRGEGQGEGSSKKINPSASVYIPTLTPFPTRRVGRFNFEMGSHRNLIMCAVTYESPAHSSATSSSDSTGRISGQQPWRWR